MITDTNIVTVWTVGRNTAGYLCESTILAHDEYREARKSLKDLIMESVDAYYGAWDCECTDTELCEGCEYEAEALAVCQEVDTAHGEPDLSFFLRPDFLPLPTVFWLQSRQVTQTDYAKMMAE